MRIRAPTNKNFFLFFIQPPNMITCDYMVEGASKYGINVKET
ncbi:hypothetical protein M902_2141 [Bacteriovorax sp. BAL6_X]|nr:hypothetical protein M902_2141 [Bacteriovorax sp. BAL6_X]